MRASRLLAVAQWQSFSPSECIGWQNSLAPTKMICGDSYTLLHRRNGLVLILRCTAIVCRTAGRLSRNAWLRADASLTSPLPTKKMFRES